MLYSGVAEKSAGSSGCRLRDWKMEVKSFLWYLVGIERTIPRDHLWMNLEISRVP
jgi:hypothetical protein